MHELVERHRVFRRLLHDQRVLDRRNGRVTIDEKCERNDRVVRQIIKCSELINLDKSDGAWFINSKRM